jgi:hypothetical protein
MGLKMYALRLPKRVGERIKAVLRDGESQSDLIRAAIERELRLREAGKRKSN